MESDKKFDKLESCTGKYRIELVTRTKTRAGIGLIDLISQPVLWIKLLLLVTKNGMSTPIFPWIYIKVRYKKKPTPILKIITFIKYGGFSYNDLKWGASKVYINTVARLLNTLAMCTKLVIGYPRMCYG